VIDEREKVATSVRIKQLSEKLLTGARTKHDQQEKQVTFDNTNYSNELSGPTGSNTGAAEGVGSTTE
jgi:hypothetical protein